MMGGLGIGANISHWSDDEMEEAKRFVALYKEIRPTILRGDLFRLESFRNSNVAAYQYVSGDRQEAVVFSFLQSQHFGSEERRLRLRGLQSDAKYEISRDDRETVIVHGSTLMNVGIPLVLQGDYRSELIRLKLVSKS
jgi:alpha-galactosidase